MTSVGAYIQAAVIVALGVIVLMLASENGQLDKSIQACRSDLGNANIQTALARNAVESQNNKIREAELIGEQMQRNGLIAAAEAEQSIAEYQRRIAELLNAPKAIDGEAVRIKLLQNVGVRL